MNHHELCTQYAVLLLTTREATRSWHLFSKFALCIAIVSACKHLSALVFVVFFLPGVLNRTCQFVNALLPRFSSCCRIINSACR